MRRSSVPYGGVREDCIETDHRVILIIEKRQVRSKENYDGQGKHGPFGAIAQ